VNPGKVIVAASVLASDFSDLRGEARRAEAAGADWLHLDVMDGHFVDNISFGPAVVSAVHKSSTLPVDVHLMIDRPDHYFSRFTESAKNITIHVEADHDVAKMLRGIREAGCSAGLALRPATAFENVIPYLKEIDLLLVMTVEPGFGGQPFMPETSPLSIKSGANVLVAGTSVFGAKDMAAAIKSLRGGI
jgi:ribulose-phosphate 3-epimerase